MTFKEKVAAAVVALGAAGGGYSCPHPTPGDPTPTPTATATATVEPTPTPFATPSPAATPTPAVPQCLLLPSTGTCAESPGAEKFRAELMVAQDQAELNGFVKDGLVVGEKAYTDEVARLLRLNGLCAINGREGGHTGDDEVWLKSTNSASYHYDIVVRDGSPMTHFASLCKPARF